MMTVEVDISGIEAGLRRLAAKEKKVQRAGLKKAAEAIADRLRENTPYYDGKRDGKWKAQRQFEKETGSNNGDFAHLRDDIKISNMNQFGEVFVGFGKETYWRVHFTEMGTIKQKPQAFIQRTEEEMRRKVMTIMVKEFKRGLGL
ncbi:HK97-gp10 family putative phage morphogenesis protein [Heyndrickxia faecalis]|jgi:HK97 gp10 family phage protein|nr:head-tail adaptor protein [Heyndrickxia coagulans]